MSENETNARWLAVRALRDRSGNVTAHLDRLLGEAHMLPADKDFARELALGVLRRQGTLEAVLRAFLRRPKQKLPGPLRAIIYVALYQMMFLDRVPTFAAVDQAVTQASRSHHKRQGGLVNGILRSVDRSLSEPAEGSPAPAADIIPIGPGRYCKIARPVLGDPSSRPASYLADAYSLPIGLARRWIEQFGSLDKVLAVGAQANVRAPMILRVNSLRASVDDVLKSLSDSGIAASPHANGLSVVLTENTNVGELDVLKNGLVQVQDATATAVSIAARPKAGTRVLDFCAAPGTKTTHLAELMGDKGTIAAVDISQPKVQRIEDNCQRLGISIVDTLLAEQIGRLDPESFDMALVDAPCSNSGVLARRAEARWRFDEASLVKLATDQRLLATAASRFVRRGGRLVYSTCSIEPEECSFVARRLAGKGSNLKLISERLTIPTGASDPTRCYDGGYVAIFEVT